MKNDSNKLENYRWILAVRGHRKAEQTNNLALALIENYKARCRHLKKSSLSP